MQTNIFRIDNFHCVKWARLIPASLNPQNIHRKEFAQKIISAHHKLQSLQFLTVYGRNFSDNFPSLWIFSINDFLNKEQIEDLTELKTVEEEEWKYTNENKRISFLIIESFLLKLERSMKKFGYIRYGKMFIKCKNNNIFHDNTWLKNSYLSCEFSFLVSHSSLFIFAKISKRKGKTLSEDCFENIFKSPIAEEALISPHGYIFYFKNFCKNFFFKTFNKEELINQSDFSNLKKQKKLKKFIKIQFDLNSYSNLLDSAASSLQNSPINQANYENELNKKLNVILPSDFAFFPHIFNSDNANLMENRDVFNSSSPSSSTFDYISNLVKYRKYLHEKSNEASSSLSNSSSESISNSDSSGISTSSFNKNEDTLDSVSSIIWKNKTPNESKSIEEKNGKEKQLESGVDVKNSLNPEDVHEKNSKRTKRKRTARTIKPSTNDTDPSVSDVFSPDSLIKDESLPPKRSFSVCSDIESIHQDSEAWNNSVGLSSSPPPDYYLGFSPFHFSNLEFNEAEVFASFPDLSKVLEDDGLGLGAPPCAQEVKNFSPSCENFSVAFEEGFKSQSTKDPVDPNQSIHSNSGMELEDTKNQTNIILNHQSNPTDQHNIKHDVLSGEVDQSKDFSNRLVNILPRDKVPSTRKVDHYQKVNENVPFLTICSPEYLTFSRNQSQMSIENSKFNPKFLYMPQKLNSQVKSNLSNHLDRFISDSNSKFFIEIAQDDNGKYIYGPEPPPALNSNVFSLDLQAKNLSGSVDDKSDSTIPKRAMMMRSGSLKRLHDEIYETVDSRGLFLASESRIPILPALKIKENTVYDSNYVNSYFRPSQILTENDRTIILDSELEIETFWMMMGKYVQLKNKCTCNSTRKGCKRVRTNNDGVEVINHKKIKAENVLPFSARKDKIPGRIAGDSDEEIEIVYQTNENPVPLGVWRTVENPKVDIGQAETCDDIHNPSTQNRMFTNSNQNQNENRGIGKKTFLEHSETPKQLELSQDVLNEGRHGFEKNFWIQIKKFSSLLLDQAAFPVTDDVFERILCFLGDSKCLMCNKNILHSVVPSGEINLVASIDRSQSTQRIEDDEMDVDFFQKINDESENQTEFVSASEVYSLLTSEIFFSLSSSFQPSDVYGPLNLHEFCADYVIPPSPNSFPATSSPRPPFHVSSSLFSKSIVSSLTSPKQYPLSHQYKIHQDPFVGQAFNTNSYMPLNNPPQLWSENRSTFHMRGEDDTPNNGWDWMVGIEKIHPDIVEVKGNSSETTTFCTLRDSKSEGELVFDKNSIFDLQDPPILIGYQDDWLISFPKSFPFWEKIPLEPYSPKKSVSYIVLCPDSSYFLKNVQFFFQQLSCVYEACQLGFHLPMKNVFLNDKNDLNPNLGIAKISLSDPNISPNAPKEIKFDCFLQNLTTICKNIQFSQKNFPKDFDIDPSVVVYVISPTNEPKFYLRLLLHSLSLFTPKIHNSDSSSPSDIIPFSTRSPSAHSNAFVDPKSNGPDLNHNNIPPITIQLLSPRIFSSFSDHPRPCGFRDLALTVFSKIRRNTLPLPPFSLSSSFSLPSPNILPSNSSPHISTPHEHANSSFSSSPASSISNAYSLMPSDHSSSSAPKRIPFPFSDPSLSKSTLFTNPSSLSFSSIPGFSSVHPQENIHPSLSNLRFPPNLLPSSGNHLPQTNPSMFAESEKQKKKYVEEAGKLNRSSELNVENNKTGKLLYEPLYILAHSGSKLLQNLQPESLEEAEEEGEGEETGERGEKKTDFVLSSERESRRKKKEGKINHSEREKSKEKSDVMMPLTNMSLQVDDEDRIWSEIDIDCLEPSKTIPDYDEKKDEREKRGMNSLNMDLEDSEPKKELRIGTDPAFHCCYFWLQKGKDVKLVSVWTDARGEFLECFVIPDECDMGINQFPHFKPSSQSKDKMDGFDSIRETYLSLLLEKGMGLLNFVFEKKRSRVGRNIVFAKMGSISIEEYRAWHSVLTSLHSPDSEKKKLIYPFPEENYRLSTNESFQNGHKSLEDPKSAPGKHSGLQQPEKNSVSGFFDPTGNFLGFATDTPSPCPIPQNVAPKSIRRKKPKTFFDLLNGISVVWIREESFIQLMSSISSKGNHEKQLSGTQHLTHRDGPNNSKSNRNSNLNSDGKGHDKGDGSKNWFKPESSFLFVPLHRAQFLPLLSSTPVSLACGMLKSRDVERTSDFMSEDLATSHSQNGILVNLVIHYLPPTPPHSSVDCPFLRVRGNQRSKSTDATSHQFLGNYAADASGMAGKKPSIKSPTNQSSNGLSSVGDCTFCKADARRLVKEICAEFHSLSWLNLVSKKTRPPSPLPFHCTVAKRLKSLICHFSQ